jgi:RNA polymerase sigma-70 factor (ECF subfamily)
VVVPAPLVLSVEGSVRDKAERQTLAALREGQHAAYEAVIDAHYPSIYRLLLLLSGDKDMAEDLTQEVFTAAWQAIRKFRGRASIKTWLHRIAYNTFVNMHRRQSRDRTLAQRQGSHRSEVSGDPLSQIIVDERATSVCRALANLDADERAVLVLHYVEGLSYREMASVLDRPNGTIKWLTSHAMGRLRKRLVGRVEV